MLAELGGPPPTATCRSSAELGFVGAGAQPEELARTVNRARVFAGFAGWSTGQLETELERDDWILEPAQTDDVFAPDPERLWSDVLERKGGEYALILMCCQAELRALPEDAGRGTQSGREWSQGRIAVGGRRSAISPREPVSSPRRQRE